MVFVFKLKNASLMTKQIFEHEKSILVDSKEYVIRFFKVMPPEKNQIYHGKVYTKNLITWQLALHRLPFVIKNTYFKKVVMEASWFKFITKWNK